MTNNMSNLAIDAPNFPVPEPFCRDWSVLDTLQVGDSLTFHDGVLMHAPDLKPFHNRKVAPPATRLADIVRCQDSLVSHNLDANLLPD